MNSKKLYISANVLVSRAMYEWERMEPPQGEYFHNESDIGKTWTGLFGLNFDSVNECMEYIRDAYPRKQYECIQLVVNDKVSSDPYVVRYATGECLGNYSVEKLVLKGVHTYKLPSRLDRKTYNLSRSGGIIQMRNNLGNTHIWGYPEALEEVAKLAVRHEVTVERSYDEKVLK